ncbi:CAP domain-containing protein [Clostridium chromiireducens]|uniref:CAP domain-containing protein n=1 Tax=Clostridium chromiireducens TaxID=225345 RepID=A0A399IJ28_9CLOT|nr:CAP domain-containing protein [Clostridium chromiireducens]RII33028.1 CAP domain-containing protein [Clostridium chromiireducens]
MMKNSLRKIITSVIAATTIGSFSSLGVSAATFDSNANTYYNTILNNILNKGLIMNDGKLYNFYNTGAMQTGVTNVNGQADLLSQLGIMKIGKAIVNNETNTTTSNGQVSTEKTPVVNKVFDSNNNIVKDNNKTSTVSTSTNNQETNANSGSTQNIEKVTNNTAKLDNIDKTNNIKNDKTTTDASSNTNSVDVQGLPKLPTKYSITVQASAEQKILDLMNAKRTEAGLQPLTMDNTLVQVARYKSNDMIQNNFFDHTNPDGTKWTNWLQDIGYKYTTTGENIAYNTSDPVELFNQWWNSPGHRANMMNSSYNKVGIGVIFGNGKYMGSQEFSN